VRLTNSAFVTNLAVAVCTTTLLEKVMAAAISKCRLLFQESQLPSEHSHISRLLLPHQQASTSQEQDSHPASYLASRGST
jgi:hypothetical protein